MEGKVVVSVWRFYNLWQTLHQVCTKQTSYLFIQDIQLREYVGSDSAITTLNSRSVSVKLTELWPLLCF